MTKIVNKCVAYGREISYFSFAFEVRGKNGGTFEE
jgi:hypothetical protein